MNSVSQINEHDEEHATFIPGQITFRGKDLSIKLYDRIDPINDLWDHFVGEDKTFFRSKYFRLLESVPPEVLRFYYALIYDGESLMGCLYFQINHYNAYKSLNLDNKKARTKNSWGPNIITASKELVAKSLDFEAIILGNLLTTGQNAFEFVDQFELNEQIELSDLILDEVRIQLIQRGVKVKLAFLKDFELDVFNEPFLSKSKCEEYYRLDAQPNMVLNIDPTWKNQEDYLQAFKSKYRVGAKKAIKQKNRIVCRLMTTEDIERWKELMYSLYREIADSAPFNLFFLHSDYFAELHHQMKDECEIYGYFVEHKLVAFYTVFDLNHELDAHFLGYTLALNREYQLYKNMLIDMVTLAIEKGKEKVIFSRTAMEIKSSIGAHDIDMSCYIQHRNKLQNVLFAKFFEWLKPENSWVIRQPFR